MSHLSMYLNRTAQIIRENTMRGTLLRNKPFNNLLKSTPAVILMKGTEAPSRSPRTLFAFNTEQDIKQIATGCDADIGGTSTVHLELNKNAKVNDEIGKEATGVFWGDMRLGVKAGLEGKVRGGYAGFRNKKRPTLFGDMIEDASNHRYVALRLRLGGDAATHNSYFCNIQTDSLSTTDLWQHRLYFKRRDGGWENIYIPLDSFVRTNFGEVSEAKIEMDKERIRSIGISLLGAHSGSAGRYELGIDSIGITNDEYIEPSARGGF